MYKIERQVKANGAWYEVMLSPFKTWEECIEYLNKYSKYYPSEDKNYKITFNPEKINL